MSNKIAIITAEQMENLIYEIRGQKVMLDIDLSKLYGYETKNFNRQVKNNIEKFPSDFMFQLTKDESLRCKNFTLNENGNMRGQHIKYLPYAFTEQGIYMLMTVLKGELATKQSIALIRLFKGMKDFISSNPLISTDDYISLDTLLMLKHVSSNVDIIIFSDNKQNHLRLAEYNKFVTEYPNISIRFIQNNNIFHDRYIILDYNTKTEKIFHCGASSKDAGKKITTITESKEKNMYMAMVNTVFCHQSLILN